jgi:N-acetylneuraminic acid mutarotase
MPTARWVPYIAVVQGKIYVLGGECCTADCQPLRIVEIYDPANDSWVTGTPLPVPPRWRGAAAAANGIIYVVGGQATCGGELATNEAFDPARNSWTRRQPMAAGGRHGFRIAVVFDSRLRHEVLYAIGGFNGQPLDRVEMYDPRTDTWTLKHSMPTARYYPEVATVNGKIYAIGGTFDAPLHTVEEYDPVTDTWTTKAPMPTTRGGGSATGVVNGIIYVAGGSADNRQLSTVEAYNPVTDTWSTIPPMPTARDSLAGAAVNNTFYAIGGILSGGAATVGQPFIYQVTASNYPSSYDAGGLPPGLSIDHTTGVIFGVPTTPLYNAGVPLSATNANGTGHSSITFSVQSAPPFSPAVNGLEIVSSTSATGRTNQPFRFQIVTKDPPNPRSTRFVAGGLPPGLTINTLSGLISGTPTSDGNFPASVSVTEGDEIANGILQLTFISDPTIPIMTSSSQALISPRRFFSRKLTADSFNPIFTYIGTDGQKHGPQATCEGLPPGLCFDGIDTISGTYNPTPTPTPTPGNVFESPGLRLLTKAPDTIKIRPRFFIEPTATDPDGTGVAPLNFLVR